MKRYRYLVPLLASLFILFFTGCYSEATTSNGSVSLTVSSKGTLGDSGAGVYLKAKFYDADVMDELIDNETLYWVDNMLFLVEPLPDPLVVFSDYLGATQTAGSGSFTVQALVPKRYRLLLEKRDYSEVEGVWYDSFSNYAGISDAFTVSAGETASVSVELLQASGF